MEITRKQSGEILELTITGRLDAYWSDHLSKELTELLREGSHRVRLNLADVKYLSSAGIGVLVQFYQQFNAIQGSFSISHASPQVKMVLNLTRLDTMLIADASGATAAPPVSAPAPAAPTHRQLDRPEAAYDVFETARGAKLNCRVIGDPANLNGCRFREEDCRPVRFPDSTFAVGLGAFGDGFADCRAQFGEFVAVGGATACLPTDGTNVPDYMMAAETFIPELNVIYGLSCEGRMAQLARFESKKETGPVKLTGLLRTCLELAGVDAIGVVIAAESAGLMGTALRRSPALGGADSDQSAPFGFPAVREWLSFSAERTHLRSLALVAGVVTQRELKPLASVLRPLTSKNGLAGHFHSAVFSYRPLKKGELDLKATVKTLFENEHLQSVLHLLNDDREITGAGESEFVRGACWFSPITINSTSI